MAVAETADSTSPRDRARSLRERLSAARRLPVVLQAEAAECGLACLAMAAAFFGRHESLAGLRRRFQISRHGASLRDLMRVADALDLSTRAVKVELETLAHLRKPAILHWDMNHFVVLKSATRRKIVIHDPATGRREMSLAEASPHLTGVALELVPTEAFETRDARERVRLTDLWTRAYGLGGSLAQLFLLAALLQIAAIVTPLVNQVVVDEAITKGDLGILGAMLFGFGVLLTVQAGLTYLRGFVALYLGTLFSFQMRSNLLRHFLRLPADFAERRSVGELMNRFEALRPIQELFTSGVITIALDGLMSVALLIFMLIYAPSLTLVVVAVLALYLSIRMFTYFHIRRLTDQQISKDAELNSIFLEILRSARSIKTFGREQERHAVWQTAFADSTNVRVRLQRLTVTGAAGEELLRAAELIGVLYFGAKAVVAGDMTLGMLFAFQAYRGQFADRARGLVDQLLTFRLTSVYLDRIADLIHADPEVNLDSDGAEPAPLKGAIQIRAGAFRYGETAPWIFQNLDLEVAAGERVAITGASGGGKTTLLKTLIGLHPLTVGEIRFDGQPAGDAGWRALRARFGVVMQDDQLLTGSVAENIAFFAPDLDQAKVENAARRAAVHKDIRGLPMGYQTLIGDLGASLSAGQIQRLMLARALYRNPDILFLDEGTANLDPETEARIVQSLSELACTQIIIAHRPAAISYADRVLKLDDGVLIDITDR
ncbi:MAG: peptidase domain-containing ABC transporter [Maricaulaceae bacterium]